MTRSNNVLNIPKYLEQTNNDKRKKPKFETKVIDYSNGTWVKTDKGMIFKENKIN
jgi:hypothetical protein